MSRVSSVFNTSNLLNTIQSGNILHLFAQWIISCWECEERWKNTYRLKTENRKGTDSRISHFSLGRDDECFSCSGMYFLPRVNKRRLTLALLFLFLAHLLLHMRKHTKCLCMCITHCAEGNPPVTLASTPEGIMGLLGGPSNEADIPDDGR